MLDIALTAVLVSCPLASGSPGPAPPPVAATDWPDTPCGRWARDYFAAWGEGEEELRRFCAERGLDPDEEAEARTLLGALEIGDVRAEGEFVVVALVRSEKLGAWASARVELDPAPPHAFRSMSMRPARDPSLEDSGFDPDKSLGELVELAREHAGSPAVAVAVVQGGAVAETATRGGLTAESEVELAPTHRFHLGSVTKPVTATVVAELVEASAFDWDTTLAEALPDVEMLAAYRAVTVEDLLQHRGGIRPWVDDEVDEFPDFFDRGLTATEERAAFVGLVLSREPVAAPGTRMVYSNAGYAVAVHVAERLAGEPYEALASELVLEPLGLASAGFGWPAELGAEEPIGHYGPADELRPQELASDRRAPYLNGSGGLSASILDLAAFASAHLDGLRGREGVFSAASVERLHTPLERGGIYASGWGLETTEGETVHWHGGSAGCFYAHVALWPERDLAIAFVANSSDGVPSVVRELQLALREKYVGASEDR